MKKLKNLKGKSLTPQQQKNVNGGEIVDSFDHPDHGCCDVHSNMGVHVVICENGHRETLYPSN